RRGGLAVRVPTTPRGRHRDVSGVAVSAGEDDAEQQSIDPHLVPPKGRCDAGATAASSGKTLERSKRLHQAGQEIVRARRRLLHCRDSREERHPMKQCIIAAGLVLVLAGAACQRKPQQQPTATGVTKVLTVQGFKTPE